MPTIITENDISEWNDETGVRYHFPKRYLPYLPPGTPVIYYKGRQQSAEHASLRLSKDPYYFGVAVVGEVVLDPESAKGDYYCTITHYRAFEHAVPIRANALGATFEQIPPTRLSNFWRDGVRQCSPEVFQLILTRGGLALSGEESVPAETNDGQQGGELALQTIMEDGTGRRVYGVKYERNRKLRALAIQEHGVICKGCQFDYGKTYGEHGQGYIHVHHLKPIAETGGPTSVNARNDMTVLCANCHAMVHRFPNRMLSIAELHALLEASKKSP
jgi:5-methylcytosine-specific restriction protein A